MVGFYSYYGLGTNMIGELHAALDRLYVCNDFEFSSVILKTDSLVFFHWLVLGSCS